MLYLKINFNIIVIFPNNIHHFIYYLKCNSSETGFCLRLQGVPTQLSLIGRASHCLRDVDGDRMQSPKCRVSNEGMKDNIH
jgi:hypothetical protein